MRIRKAHEQAAAKYVLLVYPGRVTVLGVEDQLRVDGEGYIIAPHFGWSNLAAEGLEIHYGFTEFSTNEFYMCLLILNYGKDFYNS